MNSVDRYTQIEWVSPDLLKLIEPESDANDGRYSQLSELLYDLYRENSEVLFESCYCQTKMRVLAPGLMLLLTGVKAIY